MKNVKNIKDVFNGFGFQKCVSRNFQFHRRDPSKDSNCKLCFNCDLQFCVFCVPILLSEFLDWNEFLETNDPTLIRLWLTRTLSLSIPSKNKFWVWLIPYESYSKIVVGFGWNVPFISLSRFEFPVMFLKWWLWSGFHGTGQSVTERRIKTNLMNSFILFSSLNRSSVSWCIENFWKSFFLSFPVTYSGIIASANQTSTGVIIEIPVDPCLHNFRICFFWFDIGHFTQCLEYCIFLYRPEINNLERAVSILV